MKKLNLLSIGALCFLVAGIASSSKAQFVATNAAPFNSPAHLIQNVFMSSSITAFNFTYNGIPNANVNAQVGYFTGGGPIIGIDSGLCMSTGHIGSLDNTFYSPIFTGIGDPDVLAIAQSVPWGNAPTVMRDRAVLEFDFVAPQNDSIAFEYVFGSDEWPSYPCSVFNDAFGFFVSGPGIVGPYMGGTAVNVSVVPGTVNLPVAISSIHNGTGSSPCSGNPTNNQFYNSVTTPTPFAYAAPNAFTDVFTTKLLGVNACDTYHVKLAICDGQDQILNSTVFLKAKSFEFRGITVNPQPTYNPFGFDTALYEGCGDLELSFERVDSVYPPYTMSFYIAGTATMGVDYEPVPGCSLVNGIYECDLTFAQDSTSVTIDIEIYYDNLAEIFETFYFVVDDPNVTLCGDNDTLKLTIVDQPDLQISTFGNTTLDCNDPPAAIGVNVLGGLPPYTYLWNNAITNANQSVQPNVTSSYTVQVEDGCGHQTETGVVTVGVFNVPWSVTKQGDKQTINCTDGPVNIGVQVQFNDGVWHGDISYAWSTGQTSNNINVFSTADTSYTVTITRGCTGETVVKNFDLYVYNDPVLTFTQDTDVEDIACPGDPIEISVQASGGYPPYTYAWSNGSTNPTTTVTPILSDSFFVTVTDICGLEVYTDYVYVPVPIGAPLRINGIGNDTLPCANLKAHFGPAVPRGGFGWGYELTWSDFETLENSMQSIIQNDTFFTIKLTDGCHVDTVEKTVHAIIANHTDLALSITNDTVICQGDVFTVAASGSNGGGNFKYFWNGSNSATGRHYTVDPFESGTYKVRMTDQCDSTRFASVDIDVSSVTANFTYEYVNDYEVVFTDKSWSTDTIKWHSWTVSGAGLKSNEPSPILNLPDGKAYETTLDVLNQYGCEDRTQVKIMPEYHLYLPSSFTPNSDGHNESWQMESLGIREFKLEVYDRWGNLLFETREKGFKWDGTYKGKRLPMGAYAWRMVLYTDHDEYLHREGTVLLLNDYESRQ